MGVKTKSFGPFAWILLEGLSKYYDEFMQSSLHDSKSKCRMKMFMKEAMFSIGFILPCVYCRLSYQSFTNPDCDKNLDIERMLSLKDGAKKLVYWLHRRVSLKLETQELSKARTKDEKKIVKQKWKNHNISYTKALRLKYPSITSFRFWNAIVVFLGFVICDFRKEESHHLNGFLQVISKILSLDTKDEKVLKLHNSFAFAIKEVDFSKEQFEERSGRFSIVWMIKKYVFAVHNWEFNHTAKTFQDKCESSIVTKCDMKTK